VANYNAYCSVCVANNEPLPIQAESFSHLFFECYHSSKFRKMAETGFFPEMLKETEDKKRIFWLLGVIPHNGSYICNRFMQSAVFTINFLIWKAKLGKIVVSLSIFKSDFKFMCRCLLSKSGKLREAKNKCSFFLCRQDI
jgi:hypothetical protein